MRTKRHLGQNFLTGPAYPRRIVGAVNPTPGEPILEIGPGEGALTGLLLEAGAHVTALEVDPDLQPLLLTKYGSDPRFKLLLSDALETDLGQLFPGDKRIRVVANLPYYISTPLLQRLIAHRHCFSEMTLMLQREVVERMVAPPGGKEYGYLSVLVQLYAEVSSLFDVPPGAFRPVPRVFSSVVRLRLSTTPRVPVADASRFLLLARVLFAQRRKTIFNNLRAGLGPLAIDSVDHLPALLTSAQIDGQRRAETLSLLEIARLADLI
ncbi:MAG: ribosomal RNA small subunit methyltransferase A [Acidobacteria bacterium]|nr:ribosomal RNA small subunit methyltransferase A [Acidobacteriota bacterium]